MWCLWQEICTVKCLSLPYNSHWRETFQMWWLWEENCTGKCLSLSYNSHWNLSNVMSVARNVHSIFCPGLFIIQEPWIVWSYPYFLEKIRSVCCFCDLWVAWLDRTFIWEETFECNTVVIKQIYTVLVVPHAMYKHCLPSSYFWLTFAQSSVFLYHITHTETFQM